ncbi:MULTISPECIES: hypothetical protein [Arcobacteraceae]|uniref:hypothetical protein n=1 Tax=Arcobacteraceae TaxID=2808963 RepID=UPI000DE84935|nr:MULTISPECIES: hypothetical protein [Arcobacteraceae]MBL3520350.1 hypothetical protein [Aliarcobacter lanthieri]RBQ27277.1 hypothetical protein CRU88_01045 [Arcobacter sp. CECT 9188]
MIVAVKKRKKNNSILKILSIVLLCFGIVYLIYLNEQKNTIKFELQKAQEEELNLIKIEKEKKEKEQQDAQRIILIEAEKVVDLVGQEYIEDVKIVKNKIVYIFKPNTNIDAITIRYGAMALVKKTFNEIVVVIDIEHILKSRLK